MSHPNRVDRSAVNRSPVVETWHAVVECGDFERLGSLLAPDVVFESPVVHTPQEGADITARYLVAAFGVLVNPTWRYVDEWIADRSAVLEFETEVNGIVINGVDVMHWNDAGLIIRFKVFLRPLKAVNLVHQMMARGLGLAP